MVFVNSILVKKKRKRSARLKSHFKYVTKIFIPFQLTPIGTTIFQGIQARDADAGVNGLVEYLILPGDGKGLGNDDGIGRNRITVADGYGFFSINLPHQGQVTVNRSLDYEKTQRYLVTVVASVIMNFKLLC